MHWVISKNVLRFSEKIIFYQNSYTIIYFLHYCQTNFYTLHIFVRVLNYWKNFRLIGEYESRMSLFTSLVGKYECLPMLIFHGLEF